MDSTTSERKPRLAFVGNHGELCGASSYMDAIASGFSKYFDSEIFDIKSAALLCNPNVPEDVADAYLEELCKKIAEFDFVSLQIEWGVYGARPTQIAKRLARLISASPNILLTFHSLRFDSEDWREAYDIVRTALMERVDHAPFWIHVHLPRDVDYVKANWGFDNVSFYPAVFLTLDRVADIESRADVAIWKRSLGFSEQDTVVSRFGFFGGHKDQLVGLRALKHLPPEYKFVFMGGQHPASIQRFKMSTDIKEALEFLEGEDQLAQERGDPPLSNRVRFCGHPTDYELYNGMCCSDFVIVTHQESGQSSTGIGSIALQFSKKIVATYNHSHMDYDQFYPSCFEFYDVGNYQELAFRILNFREDRVQNLKKHADMWSVDGLEDFYFKVFNETNNEAYSNSKYYLRKYRGLNFAEFPIKAVHSLMPALSAASEGGSPSTFESFSSDGEDGKAPEVSVFYNKVLGNSDPGLSLLVSREPKPGTGMYWCLRFYNVLGQAECSDPRNVSVRIILRSDRVMCFSGAKIRLSDGKRAADMALTSLCPEWSILSVSFAIGTNQDGLVFDLVLAEGLDGEIEPIGRISIGDIIVEVK
ncbi:hypothetical protein [Desulfosediminicola sp.]|uniref:hypothetical protein n=1 Tax=Desulfosediminicola sp. TaxID=2886825 RepID=UPI003AF26799